MERDNTTLFPRVSPLQLHSPPVQTTQAKVVPVSKFFNESLEMSIGESFEPTPFPPPHQRQPDVVGSEARVSFSPGLLAVATEVINVMLNKNDINRIILESSQGCFSASALHRAGRRGDLQYTDDAEGSTEVAQECFSAVISNNSGTSDLLEGTDDHEGNTYCPPTRNKHELHWEFRFERLLAFKEMTGHCLVPSDYHLDLELSRWVKRQRHQYKKLKEGKHSTMSQYRFEKLQNVGFVWDVYDLSWNENLQELREFYKSRGHCNVPTSYPDNPKLPIWVKSQRREYKQFCMGQKSQLTPERIAALDALQFRWGLISLFHK